MVLQHLKIIANQTIQILETFQFRTGFGPQETIATHARKRYRLVPSRHLQPDAPQVDPSLFIVHYSTCEPNDRVPANIITLPMQIQQVMQTRSYLQSQGQIVKRDFMLHDRANWPQISMPPGVSRGIPGRQQAFSGPARIPQNVAYPTQGTQYQAHQPNKRLRTNPPGPSGVVTAVPSLENGIEEEEDTVRGDVFDQLTPREISYCRYKQNHEWMEEIFSSPYNTSQIEPVDLGLGKSGTLEKLTEGIYESPKYAPRPPQTKDNALNYFHDPLRLSATSSYIAKLDPEKAEEFRKRTSEHVEQTNAEVEKMKVNHAKKMAKFKAGSIISAGEKQLRKAVTDPDDVGPEFWRMEGRLDPADESMGPDAQNGQKETKLKVDDIVAQVEASLGRTAAVVQEVKRIQDGGLEERQERPVAADPPINMANNMLARDSRTGSLQSGSGVLVGDTDMGLDEGMDDNLEGGGQAAGLLDEFHTGEAGSASAFSSHSTPGQSFSTPQAMLQHHSAAGTPSALGIVSIPSPHQGSVQSQGRTPQPNAVRQHSFGGGGTMDMDVEMGDAPEQRQGGDGTGGADDWIVVPPGGVSPSHATAQDPGITSQADGNENNTSSGRHTTATETTSGPAQDLHQHPTPAANISGGVDTSGFEFSPADDTTADFGNAGDGGELDLGMDLGMDDSAFGDAFHGVEGVRDAEGMGEDHGGI